LSSRKTHTKTAEAVIAGLVTQIMQPLAALTNTPCPTCGQRTLLIEHYQRSGIIVSCSGLDPVAKDPEAAGCTFCQVDIFTTDNELPNVTLTLETKSDAPALK
jgi:hypothetical protein